MTHPCTPEPCVGSVLFWERKLLLIQRGQDPGAGKWSLPGGRLEPQETWQEAVERETEEETCLKVRCGKFIGWVEREADGRRYLIADFLAPHSIYQKVFFNRLCHQRSPFSQI